MHIVLFHFHTDKPNPVYQEIAKGLRNRGHTVWLGAPNRHGDLEWHDGKQVVGVVAGPRSVNYPLGRRWEYWWFMIRVRAALRRSAPDIVQINPTMLVWILALWPQRGTHYILDIRQINEAVDDRLKTKLKEIRDVLLLKSYAHFIFEHTSFCHQSAAMRIMGKAWLDRSSVVPVGIDDHFLSSTLNDGANTAKGRTQNHHVATASAAPIVRFVYIGGLTRLRNLQNLLAAARVLKVQNLQFQLHLVGTDHAQGYYHELVDKWSISDVAAICDPVPYAEVPQRLLEYDVGMAYVPDRPTWHYQPTIKVLEYRALGMPIISTDVATHREVVEEGVNGLLVQDKVECIATAMQEFICNPRLLARCRANAAKMRRGITWAEIAQRYEGVYQRVTA